MRGFFVEVATLPPRLSSLLGPDRLSKLLCLPRLQHKGADLGGAPRVGGDWQDLTRGGGVAVK